MTLHASIWVSCIRPEVSSDHFLGNPPEDKCRKKLAMKNASNRSFHGREIRAVSQHRPWLGSPRQRSVSLVLQQNLIITNGSACL